MPHRLEMFGKWCRGEVTTTAEVVAVGVAILPTKQVDYTPGRVSIRIAFCGPHPKEKLEG